MLKKMMIKCPNSNLCPLNFSAWHSKKEESEEYGEKSEHGKKGGDKKQKKWGHKKG